MWHYVNFHSSQAPAVESWDPSCSGGIPSALSRLIPTAETCSCNGRSMDVSNRSQSGMTSGHSTGDHGAGTWTLWRAVFRAKTYRARVHVEDLPEAVRVSGLRCRASLARFGLSLSARKTHRTYVPLDLAPSSTSLPAWGMTHDGACWELGTSVPPHKQRNRIWIAAANADGVGAWKQSGRRCWEGWTEEAELALSSADASGQQVGCSGQSRGHERVGYFIADSSSLRLGEEWKSNRSERGTRGPTTWWAAEPDVVRVVHGLPNRVDRIRALGNAQIPAVAALAWEILGDGTDL